MSALQLIEVKSPEEFPEVVSELSFLKNVCYFSLMYFV